MMQIGIDHARNILKKYNIPLPEEKLAKSKHEALEFASRVRYPVVLKVASRKIIHKTDVGGVKLNISSKEELEKAFDELMRIKGAESVLIQKFYEGQYVIIGFKNDKQFGPVIAFGLGGIFVEILKDISFRIAPITEKDAEEMIKEIKGYPLLAGARNTKPVKIQLLTEILVSISKLALAHPEIREMDLNPIVINENEAIAVDVRILEDGP